MKMQMLAPKRLEIEFLGKPDATEFAEIMRFISAFSRQPAPIDDRLAWTWNGFKRPAVQEP